MRDAVEDFLTTRLAGVDAPTDLSRLMTAFVERPGFESSPDNPRLPLEARIAWAGQPHPLLDHDYLTDIDRADPDIMANVRAMDDTARMIRFVLMPDRTRVFDLMDRQQAKITVGPQQHRQQRYDLYRSRSERG